MRYKRIEKHFAVLHIEYIETLLCRGLGEIYKGKNITMTVFDFPVSFYSLTKSLIIDNSLKLHKRIKIGTFVNL